MSYNNKDRARHFSEQHINAAGKITILTTASGLLLFLLVFLLNLGQTEFKTVEAQSGTATTSVNVLNTPPEFLLAADEPQEETESSATNPTNSGQEVAFVGTGTDQNGAPYFLLVCETNAATPQAGDGNGSAAPICTNGDQIAVSTSTVSATEARAATTTTEAMSELNTWYAFACDDDPDNPECSPGYQGTTTTASPFVVNHRPTFTAISEDGPVDPGGTLTFSATTSDSDSAGGNDTMRLVVCVANDYDANTNACGPAGTIASSSFAAGTPVVLPAATTTASPLQDDTYDAYVFVYDEHGHEATGGQQGANEQYDVANVAPTISGAQITLNEGANMVLTEPASTTDGFTLTYVATDNNSCQNSSAGSEITGQVLSVFRSGISSTTCDATGDGDADGDYDPNNCYPSDVGPATWNVSCVASSTVDACSGPSDATQGYECTFPLWYVADATDAGSVYPAEDWRAAVSAVDDNNATSSYTQSTTANIEVQQALYFALDTTAIPFGSLAPGDDSVAAGSTSIPTNVRPTGNVGIDLQLRGLQMCPDTVSVGSCANANGTSSIAVGQIKYDLGPFSDYTTDGSSLALGDVELELDAPKATTTLSQPTRAAYWALEVPGTITFAGAYTGRNTFTAVTAETGDW